MRFGILQEGDTPPGASVPNRYHEMIREAVLADQEGFDFWGVSEQHFNAPHCTTSSPEALLGAVAILTQNIKLRQMSHVLLTFNHPLRTAEHLATLDIISRGRVEIGTARSNNSVMHKAFGVDPNDTRAQWRESLSVIVKALTEETVQFAGKYFNIPETRVEPRLYQNALPKIFVSANSFETCKASGAIGIGVMLSNHFGWEYSERCIETYKSAVASAAPDGNYEVNNSFSHLVLAHCARTRAEAIEQGRPAALGFAKWVVEFLGKLGSSKSPNYEYMASMKKEIEHHGDDLEYLMDATPWFLIGTPDEVIERAQKFSDLGVDEMLLRMDGYGHQNIMSSIGLIGKYVLPEFKRPQTVIRQSGYEERGVTVPRYLP